MNNTRAAEARSAHSNACKRCFSLELCAGLVLSDVTNSLLSKTLLPDRALADDGLENRMAWFHCLQSCLQATQTSFFPMMIWRSIPSEWLSYLDVHQSQSREGTTTIFLLPLRKQALQPAGRAEPSPLHAGWQEDGGAHAVPELQYRHMIMANNGMHRHSPGQPWNAQTLPVTVVMRQLHPVQAILLSCKGMSVSKRQGPQSRSMLKSSSHHSTCKASFCCVESRGNGAWNSGRSGCLALCFGV